MRTQFKLNKWQWGISLTPDYVRMQRGWKIFDLYLINLLRFPEMGAMISKGDYKGAWIRFAVFIPIESA